MTKQNFLVGNWKMNKSISQARNDYLQLSHLALEKKLTQNYRIAIAAPLLSCAEIKYSGNISHLVSLFAQHCHFAPHGAFTGETPVGHLKEIGIAGSILGHSERRTMFGDNNELVGKACAALLKNGLEAIVCVGETLPERESGKYLQTVQKQMTDFLSSAEKDLNFGTLKNCAANLTIAYEPVWAIGTGKAADAKMAQEVHECIRKTLDYFFNENTQQKISILYGGSVNSQNAKSFLDCTEINGALVGGASLVPSEFIKLAI
jgi:triosephosphate isomerase (TIM)